jgi:hypothetical protein
MKEHRETGDRAPAALASPIRVIVTSFQRERRHVLAEIVSRRKDGDLYLEKGDYGAYEQCIQCGHSAFSQAQLPANNGIPSCLGFLQTRNDQATGHHKIKRFG